MLVLDFTDDNDDDDDAWNNSWIQPVL